MDVPCGRQMEQYAHISVLGITHYSTWYWRLHDHIFIRLDKTPERAGRADRSAIPTARSNGVRCTL